MESVPVSAITLTVLFIVFALCMSLIVVVLEDNKLDPLDSFLVNEVQLAGALTPEVIGKFEVAVAVMNLNPENFNFTGSTTVPVARGENAYITYVYNLQANQKTLEHNDIPTIDTARKEFFVMRTGR